MKLTPAGAELFALMTWSRAFDAPIPLPDGGEITTSREAGEYLCLSWEPPQFGRQGRGRDEDFSSPPAQIPACAANAPGSSLGSDVVR
jgi:hypothetical protein